MPILFYGRGDFLINLFGELMSDKLAGHMLSAK